MEKGVDGMGKGGGEREEDFRYTCMDVEDVI